MQHNDTFFVVTFCKNFPSDERSSSSETTANDLRDVLATYLGRQPNSRRGMQYHKGSACATGWWIICCVCGVYDVRGTFHNRDIA